ncbi:MarR family winged helix-turn-helix transcriptional regulator [Agromyces atrinae]|uniref:DNA-binding MarR family transcriptional regulator n=2 Tax=Agromyces atrinae TaxID=592376 RepID=A0A852SLH8_9MICO|nr:MarR family winged helix-turn-helix transcriptional regulator [Agromyces atrinae]NYD67977.1 DNA-binding MarR family transcriptional regulator [Agromyces atrinae]
MSDERQAAHGGLPGEGIPAETIARIEQALIALRHDRRRGGPGGFGGPGFGGPGFGGPGGFGMRGAGPRGGAWGPGFGRGRGEHEHGEADGGDTSHDHANHAHEHHGRGPAAFRHMARIRLLEVLDARGATDAPAPSISELAALIGVDQPRASRLVQGAQREGLVRRTVDPRDARRSVIQLTAAGERALDESRESRRGAVRNGLAGFTPAEAEQFADLLARFAAGRAEA